MVSRKVALAIAFLLFLVAGVSWLATADGSSVRRPLFESAATKAALTEFKSATVIPSQIEKNAPPDYPEKLWDATLSVVGVDGPIKVSGEENFSLISVQYSDGKGTRHANEPADYSNNLEVRVGGSKLYVYRSVSLLWTEYRLAVFDLVSAERKGEYLVDPDELPKMPSR